MVEENRQGETNMRSQEKAGALKQKRIKHNRKGPQERRGHKISQTKNPQKQGKAQEKEAKEGRGAERERER